MHFPGIAWWEKVHDMPYDVWQGLIDVITARVEQAQKQSKAVSRGVR